MTAISTTSSALHPIIPGFHPDPSICRAGGRYYVAHSSFEYTPAVPIWSSEDLVSWTLVGHALSREDQFPAGAFRGSNGVYAPTLRYRAGLFWMITTTVGGQDGQVLVTTEDPAGEWSEPVRFTSLQGIDPDIAWDEDGRCLVTYCGRWDGAVTILQAEVDPETGEALEQPRPMWSGTGLAHPEAPHLYERDGWWYLMVAEGGTERGHAVSIARGRDPRGPFEGAPSNPILTHRSSTHPVQNTGHADLVQCADGSWAMVYLAVRPAGRTPGFHVNGRETFLAGVTWDDGWPVIDEDAFDVPHRDSSFSDTFHGPGLGLRWVSPGARLESFVETGPGGALVSPVDVLSPTALMATRPTDARWRAEATVQAGVGTAELRLHLDDRHWYAIRASSAGLAVVVRIGDIEAVHATVPMDARGPVRLRIGASEPTHGGPDDVELGYAAGSEERTLARLDGRYLSTEVAGGFTGRVLGLRALDSPVRVSRFDYLPFPEEVGA